MAEQVFNEYPGLHAFNGTKPVVKAVEPAPAVSNNDNNTPPEPIEATPAPAVEQTPAPVAVQNQVTDKPKIDIDSLSQDEVGELLKKLTGGKISSLDELNPPAAKSQEEIEAESKRRKAEALSWAFENGKVSRENYEKAIVEKAKPNRDIALQLFAAQLLADDSKLKPAEIEEIFKDAFHEDAEEGSRLFKLGQKQINDIAEAYKKSEYGVLDSIDSDYDSYTSTVNQFKGYKKAVKATVDALPNEVTFDAPIRNVDGTDGVIKITIPVDEKLKHSLVNDYSKEGVFAAFSSTDPKAIEKGLQAELSYHFKARMYDKLMKDGFDAYGKSLTEQLIVQLGNKRNPNQPELNNGVQEAYKGASKQKQNSYPGLYAAMGSKVK
jgi:hypothetical protein